MYGMVNHAVRGMVIDGFGEDTWLQICEKAGAPPDFVKMQAYDDAITYNLVGAACEILGADPADVLRGFGEYWVEHVALVDYAELMHASGANFVDFTKNLDHMHQRIRVTFPDYNPPSFRVQVVAEGQLRVDYYSDREGLLPFVEGLFNGLAKHFKESISFDHVPDDSHPLPCKRMVIHHRPV